MPELRIGSLCSGTAQLDHAVIDVLGGSLAWVSDISPGAIKLLDHRYPDVPNLGDLTQADWAEVEPVDVLTAGFPCQDISLAGKREGIQHGNRSGLWHCIADIIRVLRPGLVVLENVGALFVRQPGGRTPIDIVLGSLAEIGFDADWTCVRASDAGAAHRRERVFILAADTDRARRERGGASW